VRSDGIAAITLPTPFAIGRVNSYLIEGEPLTLVDPGPRSGEALAELEAGLALHGRRLADVGLVVLTHQHIDHVGLAQTVKERSGAELAAPAPLAGYLADVDASMDADDSFAAAVMELHGVPEEAIAALRDVVRAFRTFVTSAEVDRPLDEGDTIRLSARRLDVHFRPGHSPTDTIFVDPETRVALVGDHVLAEISSNPVLHRRPGGPVDPRLRPRALANYLNSLERTAELDLVELLPGHGPPVIGHRALIEERVEFHRLRKERIFDELREGPMTAYSIALALWGDIAVQQVYLTLSEAIGHLDLLVSERRVRELERDGTIEFEGVY